MPVLFQINAALNTGSTGKIAEQIGLTAMNNGWDVYIAHGARYTNKSKLKTLQTVTLQQERLHAVKSFALDAHGLGSKRETERLVETIKQIAPDVIHLHNIHGYFINYEILFNYLSVAGKPVVWTLHDCWSFTGHCSHFDAINCVKWKTECNSCPQKREYPKSLMLDCSKRNFRLKKELFTSVSNLTLVPVSNWLAGLLKESFFASSRILVINNGIDLNIFSVKRADILRCRLNIKDKAVVLGVASQWKADKGLYEFIKLSSNPSYAVVLVGVKPEQKEKLPDNIIAIERTNNQEELAEYYSLADVFVNPTYNDTFPTVNLESMACGTPVVTYRTGGSPESVTDDTGIVVEKGNFVELCDAVEQIITKGKDFYVSRCRNHAESLYNMNDKFNEYMELYKKLTQINNRGGKTTS